MPYYDTLQKDKDIIQLKSLSKAMEQISKSRNIDEISTELFDFIESVVDFKMAVNYVIDYKKKELKVLSSRGTNISHLRKRVNFKIGEGVVGWVAKEKKAVVIQDALLETELKVRQHYEIDPLIRSYIAIPLIVANKVVGILSISHSEPNKYDKRDVQLISIIASQIATLIEMNKILSHTRNINKHILQSVNTGIIAIDNNLKIILFNNEAEKITKFNSKEVLGKRIIDVPFSCSYKNLRIQKTLETGESFTDVESFILDKNGGKVNISFSTSPLTNENGRRIGVTTIFKDITRIKLLQEQIKRSDQLATIGKLMTSIAHEIRNPLLPIRTSASILLKKPYLKSPDKNLIRIIKEESERLNELINNFINLTHPQEEEDTETNVVEIAKKVYELVKSKCDENNICVKLPDTGPYVRLSPDKLKQIFLNLFLNSIDAIKENGNIILTISELEDEVIIEVADDGCGVSYGSVDKIFDPFYTTKDDGIGLGLSMVYNIINSAGGKITVESEPVKGTEFKIRLPKV